MIGITGIRQGEGKEGRLLERMLAAAGISGDDVSYSSQNEYKVVVAVSESSFRAMAQLTNLAKRRGSFYCIGDRWVTGLFPLTDLYRSASWQEVPVGIKILKRVKEIDAGNHVRKDWEGEVVQPDDMVEWLNSMPAHTRYAVDLETIPKDDGSGVVRCLGVAYISQDEETVARCCVWPNQSTWEALHECFLRNPFFVGHNLGYDWGYMSQWMPEMGDARVPWVDTMHAFHVLHPELSKRLEFVTMWYQGHQVPYYKDEGKIHTKQKPTYQELERYYRYNMLDCVATLWCSLDIEVELNRRGLWNKYTSWHRKNQAVALEMQSRPMLTDTQEVARLGVVLSEREDRLVEELHESAGREVNPRSPKQVLGLLKEQGVRVESTDEVELKKAYLKNQNPLLKTILDIRKIGKANGQYVLPLLPGHISFGFVPDSTKTFRFASNTHPRGDGFNMQTVPKPLRYLFPAPPGRVFIQPDLSQAEARYVAAKSRCKGLLELFQDSRRNVHMERAKFIFGKAVEKDSPEYVLAKSSLHASNYREGPRRFAEQVGCKESEAKRILAASRQMYPEIEQWHYEVLDKLMRGNATLRNCWGVERQCYGALGARIATGKIPDTIWKDAIAWEPQSAIPQIINGTIHVFRAANMDIWFHQHGHDSFLASIPEQEATQDTRKLILGVLNQPVIVHGMKLTIPADLAIGYNWGMMFAWPDDVECITRGWWEGKCKPQDDEKLMRELLYVGGMSES